MVGIGVNDYCHIGNETKVNEKGNLEIQIKAATLKEAEILKMVLEGKEITQGATRLTLFPNFKIDYNSKQRKSIGQLTKDIQDYQKQLIKFLKVYLTQEQIDAEFPLSVMLGAAANQDAFLAGLKTDEFVDKVYTHVSEKFIEVLRKFNLFENERTFRIKLWRQSETKNFPRIPGGFGEWIEPMDVPVSKLGITEYEKTNGKLKTDAPAADAVPQETTEQATSLFNDKVEDDELPFIADEK
jgi:hypothetical protein